MIFATFLLPQFTFAQEQRTEIDEASVARLISLVNSAEGIELADVYRTLFSKVNENQIESLRHGEDVSIALQASWQKVIDTSTEEERRKSWRSKNREALCWFTGFVEGRTGNEPPKWWSDYIIQRPTEAKLNWYRNAGPESVYAPEGTRVSVEGESYTLHIGDDSIQLPNSILKPQKRNSDGKLDCQVSGTFTKELCFVALHDDVGYSHNLASIVRETGKLLWETRVCGCWLYNATGIHESWVTVSVKDDQVLIYGAAHTGAYLHAFESATGKSQFKFSTVFAYRK